MLRNFPHFPSRTPWHQRRARGFTLLELMAVVILIGILAVIAIPGASRAMRERRSSSAAHEIAQLYNQARARAIGRGSAVLVRYENGGFDVREAVVGSVGPSGGCDLAPAASCTIPANRWAANATAPNRLLTTFHPLGTSTYQNLQIAFTEHSETNADAAQSVADICMTPGGRVFFRPSTASTTPFVQMTGNHEIRVWLQSGADIIGIERSIFILPNGTARVAL